MKLVIAGDEGCLSAARSAQPAGAGDDWIALPKALQAITRFNRAGWTVALAVELPALGQGGATLASINTLHASMHRQVGAAGGRIDAVFLCSPEAKGGSSTFTALLTEIGARYGQSTREIHAAFVRDDHLRAALSVGCIVLRIDPGASARAGGSASHPDEPERTYADFSACADALTGSVGTVRSASGDNTVPTP